MIGIYNIFSLPFIIFFASWATCNICVPFFEMIKVQIKEVCPSKLVVFADNESVVAAGGQ